MSGLAPLCPKLARFGRACTRLSPLGALCPFRVAPSGLSSYSSNPTGLSWFLPPWAPLSGFSWIKQDKGGLKRFRHYLVLNIRFSRTSYHLPLYGVVWRHPSRDVLPCLELSVLELLLPFKCITPQIWWYSRASRNIGHITIFFHPLYGHKTDISDMSFCYLGGSGHFGANPGKLNGHFGAKAPKIRTYATNRTW